MLSSVFQQVGTVIFVYLPVTTIQNIIASGIVNNINKLLTKSLRYDLYTNIDQMQERLNEFISSKNYFKSIGSDEITYQIWNINLYDSFNDYEIKEIKKTNVLDIVSLNKIITFCLAPHSAYFTTVQSKKKGFIQNINVWSKPHQINEYINEGLPSQHIKYYIPTNKAHFEYKSTQNLNKQLTCHGIWESQNVDDIFNKNKNLKSSFYKSKFNGSGTTYDIEFCNFYYDDNDKLIDNYFDSLKNILCCSKFAELNNEKIVKKWFAVDIQTQSNFILSLNHNLLFGLLDSSKVIKIKNKLNINDDDNTDEQKYIDQKQLHNDAVVTNNIVIHKFKFIVWKIRYKSKDLVKSSLASVNHDLQLLDEYLTDDD